MFERIIKKLRGIETLAIVNDASDTVSDIYPDGTYDVTFTVYDMNYDEWCKLLDALPDTDKLFDTPGDRPA